MLRGRNLPWDTAIHDRTEALAIFAATPQFSVDLRSVIVDGERAALELVGSAATTVGCTLENGSETTCYQLEDAGLASASTGLISLIRTISRRVG